MFHELKDPDLLETHRIKLDAVVAVAKQPMHGTTAVIATITLLNGEPLKLKLPRAEFDGLLEALDKLTPKSTHS